ncbi:MAG: DUF4087 domain-containing protein [Paracoccaceae bacterium]
MFRPLLLALALALPAQSVVAKDVVRCGWYANPSPGNHWLTDSDATWTLSTQGGPQAPGWLDLPADAFAFGSPDRWVQINGNYGYGCACVTGQFGAVPDGEVLLVRKLKALPLSRCETDPDLPRAEG